MRGLRPSTAIAAALVCTPMSAQDYPTKPVTVTLVLAAGSGLDVIARTWGEHLSQRLGKPVIFDNRLRVLAVASLTRFNSLPDVPPMAEAIGRPDFEAVSWHALMAPAATPPVAMHSLHGEMTRIFNLPEMNKAIANLHLIPVPPASIAEHQKYLAAEGEKWGALVRKLGLAGSQ